MAKDIKKQFENSFKGYHKDAPKFLKAKSKALKSKKEKEPKWKVESGKKMSKAFGALLKRNNNFEDRDWM